MRTLITAAIASFAALALAGQAAAADLIVAVRTTAGEPVKDAVVTLTYPGPKPTTPIRFAWPMSVSQHDIAFDPFVLIVPVGADVTFPNKDKVRHHVYSFSPAKRFELKLYGKEEARSVHFDKAGVVALGCNIHDRMSAFLYVVDTPYAAKTSAIGEAAFKGAPGGTAVLTVWHPYAKAPKQMITRTISVRQGVEAVVLDIRAPDKAAMPGMTH